MKDILRYGFILGFICFLASSVLAVVNGITEPKIRLQKESAQELGLKEVMPFGAIFEPKFKEGEIIYYAAYDHRHRLQGFALRLETKGYSSAIEALAGLNLNLEINQIKILSQNETPGLGNRILETSFLAQFKGKNLDTLNQVEAITGATISSLAVTNAIKNKISELKSQMLQEIAYEQ